MERFLKMQQEKEAEESKKPSTSKPVLNNFKKRPGEKSSASTAKKTKLEEEAITNAGKKDELMSSYLREIQKYQSQDCSSDAPHVRPLVK